MYIELEVQCTGMYDPKRCLFLYFETYCFCFLLTLNWENRACNVLELICVLFCVRLVEHDILFHR